MLVNTRAINKVFWYAQKFCAQRSLGYNFRRILGQGSYQIGPALSICIVLVNCLAYFRTNIGYTLNGPKLLQIGDLPAGRTGPVYTQQGKTTMLSILGWYTLAFTGPIMGVCI